RTTETTRIGASTPDPASSSGDASGTKGDYASGVVESAWRFSSNGAPLRAAIGGTVTARRQESQCWPGGPGTGQRSGTAGPLSACVYIGRVGGNRCRARSLATGRTRQRQCGYAHGRSQFSRAARQNHAGSAARSKPE